MAPPAAPRLVLRLRHALVRRPRLVPAAARRGRSPLTITFGVRMANAAISFDPRVPRCRRHRFVRGAVQGHGEGAIKLLQLAPAAARRCRPPRTMTFGVRVADTARRVSSGREAGLDTVLRPRCLRHRVAGRRAGARGEHSGGTRTGSRRFVTRYDRAVQRRQCTRATRKEWAFPVKLIGHRQVPSGGA